MNINEIFYSLQGEGFRVGQPTIFIRLSGCDLSCGFCDTEFESGAAMDDDTLLERVRQYPGQWITWTGGEPTLQLTEKTVARFREEGYQQSIETNGNHPVPFNLDWVVVSPKVAEHVLKRNFPGGVDEIRYAWHSGKQGIPEPSIRATHHYLSPIFDGNTPNQQNLHHCINLCLQNPVWSLSLQTHKLTNIL